MTENEMRKDFREQEAHTNRFNLQCLIVTMCFPVITWLLNIVGIFIVDQRLMNISMFSATGITAVVCLACHLIGLDKPWIKYLVIGSIVLTTTIIGITLTYHALLLSMLPMFYACQYSQKKVVVFTYITTVISMFAVVMIGYYVGVCDANMALLTVKPLAEYVDADGIFRAQQVNPNPWVTLPLFYVLPRSLLFLATVPILTHIPEEIAQRAIKEIRWRRRSETDDMTQLYNKNKYIQMTKEYFPKVTDIGVIFVDVNNLKSVNDCFGHEMGDELIYGVASAIRDAIHTEDKEYVFRIGGDEFVIVVEGKSEKRLQEIIDKCRENLRVTNQTARINMSAALGYEMGKGEELEEVVKRADQKMYQEKQKSKLL